ncbi:MAG: hypothetical protein Q9187_009118 [Circinaria calcarea]
MSPVTLDLGKTKARSIITPSMIGTINQNTQFQEAFWVINPPMSGPSPLPRATMAPMNPLYFPRCLRLVISLDMTITSAFLCQTRSYKGLPLERRINAYMAPPPSPLIARKAKSMAGEVENPERRLPRASKPSAVMRSGFRPKISLSLPFINCILVLAIKKLAATHEIDGPKFKLAPIAGRAVETDVWSR